MISRAKIAKQLRDDDIRCLKAIAGGREAQPKTNEIIEQYWLSPWHYVGVFISGMFFSVFVTPESFFYFNEGASGFLWRFLLSAILICYFLWMCLDYGKATRIYDRIDEPLKPRSQFCPDPWFTVAFCSFLGCAYFFLFLSCL